MSMIWESVICSVTLMMWLVSSTGRKALVQTDGLETEMKTLGFHDVLCTKKEAHKTTPTYETTPTSDRQK
ncbi:hypothetical protein EYF80_042354 [Liparis tanakae]|uniref:Uncharacterized protein n=1 Tax=Liparis tanakae TaxID=230148 RepID=A0A4Z2G1Q9_9TELE|nr:hypothetical protein EYF80_042354 [Liparis tanakae]